MKLWLKKISVVLITFITIGIYIPPTYLVTNAKEEREDAFSSNENLKEKNDAFTEISETEEYSIDSDDDLSAIDPSEDYVQHIIDQARQQTFQKLGPRITNKVKDDFMIEIFPNMEEVIGSILDDIDEDDFSFIQIDEQKSSLYGEKIFNIYNQQAKEDVARFHVRRDLRPNEGYWFNFHYHLKDDNYEEHHLLGGIYWDKNTPPKWMS